MLDCLQQSKEVFPYHFRTEWISVPIPYNPVFKPYGRAIRQGQLNTAGANVAFKLSIVKDRELLKPRREPYWERMDKGRYLGFRVNADGSKTWMLRTTDETYNHTYYNLGSLESHQLSRQYDEAREQAMTYWKLRDRGVSTTAMTVAEVCEKYVEALAVEKGKAAAYDARGRFQRLVYGKPIGMIAIQKLTTADVKSWHLKQAKTTTDDPEAERLAKDGANRNLNSFKAALNYGYKHLSVVADDGAWARVSAFKGVSRKRETNLTDSEVTALLKACPDDLKLLVEGLFLTALRPGELAPLSVADFDREHGTLNIANSKVKTRVRTVTLSSAALEYFTEQAKGKLPTAPLLARADGSYWNKDAWKKIFKTAAYEIKKPELVIYGLRHTAISRLIGGGVEVYVIAKLAGTSVAMIEKHYGHLRHNETRQKLDAVLRRA